MDKTLTAGLALHADLTDMDQATRIMLHTNCPCNNSDLQTHIGQFELQGTSANTLANFTL